MCLSDRIPDVRRGVNLLYCAVTNLRYCRCIGSELKTPLASRSLGKEMISSLAY